MPPSNASPPGTQKQTTEWSSTKSRLKAIVREIKQSRTFDDALSKCSDELLNLINAESLRIYKADKQNLIAHVEVGMNLKEIRHPLSHASIAGYSALTLTTLRINDVKNAKILASYHPGLKFNIRYDLVSGVRTRSLISAPMVRKNTVMGVLQMINSQSDKGFGQQDEDILRMISKVLASKTLADLNTPEGPFVDLIQKGLLTQEQLEALEKRTKKEKTWVSYLMRTELGILATDIGISLEKYYQVPFMKFNPIIRIPERLLKGISKFYLTQNLWVPVDGDPDNTVILVSDPKNRNRIQDIQNIVRAHSYSIRVGLPEDILNFLGVGPPLPETDTLAEAMEKRITDLENRALGEESVQFDYSGDTHLIEEDSDVAPVLYVNNLILRAHNLNASDIHIEPGKPGTSASVRMRVDGICRKVTEIPDIYTKAVTSRIKILSNMDIADRRRPQDGKTKVNLKGINLEMRIATLPTIHGESIVIRMLTSGRVMAFDQLNLTPRNEKTLKEICSMPHGIFLVVGPTGSGKTTTLHAILGSINTPDRKIWTVEDPVEITQEGLQQVQVHHDIGLNFAAVLRALLRADPDIILIGEMRDFETANIGVESSLTGHLVFSTLHTNSAPETVTRLLDFGLDPFNFSDALLGILAQRLVRTLCSDCKAPYSPSESERQRIVDLYGAEYFPELGINPNEIVLYKHVGCEKCGHTGYRGRTGIHELLVTSEEIKRIISRKGTVENIRNKAIREGMRTLIQDGVTKILQGQTDMIQLHRVAAE